MALVVVLSLAVRLVDLYDPLWLDELHTAWTVSDGIAAVAPRAADGNQSPLFFWASFPPAKFLAEPRLATRLISLVSGIVLVLAAARFALRRSGLFGPTVLAAAVIAFDNQSINWAVQGRPYALVQLLTLGQVSCFCYLVQGDVEPRRAVAWRWLFIASSVALFYTHFTTSLIVAAELVAYGLIYFCLTGSHRERQSVAYRPRQFLIDLLFVGGALLPAIPQVVRVFERRSQWERFIPLPTLTELWTILGLNRYLLPVAAWLMIMVFVHRRRLLATVRGATSARTAVAEPVAATEAAATNGFSLSTLVVLICVLAVPLILAWCCTVSNVARIFYIRYVAVSTIAAPLLLAAMCRWLTKVRWQWAWTLVVVIWLLIANHTLWHLRSPAGFDGRNEQWAAAVQHIVDRDRHLDPELETPRPVLACVDVIEDDLLRLPHSDRLEQYCLFPITGPYSLEQPARKLIPLPSSGDHRLTPTALRAVSGHPACWLLLRGRPQSALKLVEEIRAVQPDGNLQYKVTRFGAITVVEVTP